jgi:hypothetical protein
MGDGLAKSFVLNVGSAKTPSGKTFALTLSFVPRAKAPAIAVSLDKKTKLDVANPKSFITATVKLTNTTSAISSVRLLTAASETAQESKDFRVVLLPGTNKFNIVAAHKQVVPTVAQKLSVQVVLENGEVVNSWTVDSKSKTKDKPVTVNPIQTVDKKPWQSTKAIDLFRAQPLQGGAVGVSIAAPANVKVGLVQIQKASVDKFNLTGGGFVLERCGEDEYTVCFKDGKAPTVAPNKKGQAVEFKGAKKLVLEIWAEGTYQLYPDGTAKLDLNTGQVLPLRDNKGTIKSKASTVTVTINIK